MRLVYAMKDTDFGVMHLTTSNETDENGEDYAGHVDEYGLEQYYKSLEEEKEE
jgi:hypothetical protein